MALPDTSALSWSTIVGGGAAALIVLRRVLSGDDVGRANDNAQINMIATLQAERDAAVKRADDAVSARETAMQTMNKLQLQIQQLQTQVETLSAQIAALHDASKPA